MGNKTVKEIADELKINKLRVYRFIEKENIDSIETIKGVKRYDKKAQLLINKRFSQEAQKESISTNDTNDADIDTNIKRLLAEKDDRINFIEIQIHEKDQQISQLQKLLDQQQQLSLQDKKRGQELRDRISELELLIESTDNNFQDTKYINEKEQVQKTDNDTKKSEVRKWFEFWK